MTGSLVVLAVDHAERLGRLGERGPVTTPLRLDVRPPRDRRGQERKA